MCLVVFWSFDLKWHLHFTRFLKRMSIVITKVVMMMVMMHTFKMEMIKIKMVLIKSRSGCAESNRKKLRRRSRFCFDWPSPSLLLLIIKTINVMNMIDHHTINVIKMINKKNCHSFKTFFSIDFSTRFLFDWVKMCGSVYCKILQ